MVEPRSSPLKYRHDYYYAKLLGERRTRLSGISRYLLREIKMTNILGLTEVRRAEKFLETDYLCTTGGSNPNRLQSNIQIPLGILDASHLHQTHAEAI
jgi:hypothetical protein